MTASQAGSSVISVCVIHLLHQLMTPKIFVEFEKSPRFASSLRSIERVLLGTKQLVERRQEGPDK